MKKVSGSKHLSHQTWRGRHHLKNVSVF